MEQDCHICTVSFNLADHYTVVICSNRHECCIKCLKELFLTNNRRKCPFCNIQITEIQVRKRANEALQYRNKRIMDGKRQVLIKLMNQSPELSLRDKNAMIWKEYRHIRQFYDSKLAISYMKRHIQDCLKDEKDDELLSEDFLGLGSKRQLEDFIEVPGYSWYEKRYNLATLSIYDQLAVCFLVQGCEKEDIDWYDYIIRENPFDYKAVLGRAHLFQKPGPTDQFLLSNPYQKIIQLKAEFDKTNEILSLMFFDENDLVNAQKFARQCIKMDPNNVSAQYILAISDKSLTSSELQAKLLEMIDKQPMFIRAHHSYGKELFKLGKYQQALQSFEKCLSINGHYIFPIVDKASACIMLKRDKEVIKILEDTIKKWQGNDNFLRKQRFKTLHLECQYYLAAAYENSGQFAKALDFYRKVYPNHNITREKLGSIYLRMQKWASALQHYNYYKQQQCSISIIQKALECCEHLKTGRQQIQWLHKYYILEPQNIKVHVRLATTYIKGGWFVGCISWCKKFIEKGIGLQQIYPIIIDALHQNKEYRQSLRYITEYQSNFILTNQQKEKLLNYVMENYIAIQQQLNKSSKERSSIQP